MTTIISTHHDNNYFHYISIYVKNQAREAQNDPLKMNRSVYKKLLCFPWFLKMPWDVETREKWRPSFILRNEQTSLLYRMEEPLWMIMMESWPQTEALQPIFSYNDNVCKGRSNVKNMPVQHQYIYQLSKIPATGGPRNHSWFATTCRISNHL